MKRWLAFLLLLSHINTSMLLPQTPQPDVFDENGEQIDDINSVVEWVLIRLGIDQTPDDEDNDNGQHLRRAVFMACVTPPAPQRLIPSVLLASRQFGEFKSSGPANPHRKIVVPPPEQG